MSAAIPQALELALQRGLLPTSIGTAEIRALARELLDRSFWSARTTHGVYLQELKKLVERYISGEGYNNDLAQLRIEARKLLVAAGYTPEQGFPGDAALGIPSARPGSLKDLSSERRLNLIYETQAALMRGKGQKLRGLARADFFPAWELVRVEQKEAPRDWHERWKAAGGPVVVVDGITRLIAPKDAEVWSVLGDSALFPDALNVDHPPFAFSSGMGWEEISFKLWDKIKPVEPIKPAPPDPSPEEKEGVLVSLTRKAARFIGGEATFNRLYARLKERRKAAGV